MGIIFDGLVVVLSICLFDGVWGETFWMRIHVYCSVVDLQAESTFCKFYLS